MNVVGDCDVFDEMAHDYIEVCYSDLMIIHVDNTTFIGVTSVSYFPDTNEFYFYDSDYCLVGFVESDLNNISVRKAKR